MPCASSRAAAGTAGAGDAAAIAGAGPAGARLATALAEAGHEVSLVERLTDSHRNSFSSAALSRCEALRLNIPQSA